jgi:hypothetical protein
MYLRNPFRFLIRIRVSILTVACTILTVGICQTAQSQSISN